MLLIQGALQLNPYCRSRRVKCDETKPECYRCQEYGSLCQYKAPQSQAAPPISPGNRPWDLVRIQPRITPQPVPSGSVSCDAVEGNYFRVFREQLAFDLRGDSETPLWSRLIPQQCSHEPAIKHAVLALSALYKSALSCDTHTVRLHDEHFKFALVQQSQAIKLLREALASGRSHVRLALITSLLFGCLESFYGNWETATQQVNSGLNILRHMREDTTGQVATGIVDIDLEVGLTLGRLKLQILAFFALNPMCDSPFNNSNDEEMWEEVPDRFSNFDEAFMSGAALGSSALRHSRTSARFRAVEVPIDLIAQQQCRLTRRVDQWNKAYEPVFLEACENTTSHAYNGALQLRICIWKCEIMIATSISDTEGVFDDFTPQFQRITYFARHILQRDRQVRQLCVLRGQYGRGLIMALFYTATRCRDSFVRREAIAILREWPCTNGVWHSLQAAKVAEWVVCLEEGCCEGDGYIPEDRRVRMNSLKVSLQNGSIMVECMQPSDDGRLELQKTNLGWP
ncbi:hypothetical protein OIDMADRAFT_181705 [Oidiodendron maius Zn]|uniref:Zn(2)-C6 fungal-type domain-containing protein n=1 Tax=Oidiodendron maius (strain Zn) TaxID=913774 RepID=A0A0C3CGW9_OIDMZ|nr:hypothetical protein OIDMADRAFT_181705 [Oidiodendron maius Zn]